MLHCPPFRVLDVYQGLLGKIVSRPMSRVFLGGITGKRDTVEDSRSDQAPEKLYQ